MACLRYAYAAPNSTGLTSNNFRTPRVYSWDTDFPLSRQGISRYRQKSRFVLDFLLSGKDSSELKKEVGVSISENLPVEIILGKSLFSLNIRKQRAGHLSRAQGEALARFIESRFLFQYIEAIRPSSQSLQVVSALVEQELSLLQRNEDYLKALRVIEELEDPVLEALSIQVGNSLKQFLPSVKSASIERVKRTLPSRATTNRMPIQLIVDDGNATELEAKGDGVKSLVAISLLRAMRSNNEGCDVVLAIEEPESHLHPKAIRELNKVFSEMSSEHQMIITTHSPQLVVRGNLHANVIVSSSSAKQAARIKDIRDCLGVVAQDNLTAAEFVILVEGAGDERLLHALLRCRSSDLKELIDQGRIVLDNMRGASNVKYKLSNIELIFAKAIVVFDDDDAGRKFQSDAIGFGLTTKYCFSVIRPGNEESEIEDLLDSQAYWPEFCKAMGAALDHDSFMRSKLKWSERMKFTFSKASKAWSKEQKEQAKQWLLSWALENVESCLTDDAESAIDSMCQAMFLLVNER